MEPTSQEMSELIQRLCDDLAGRGAAVVALSGGVDSGLVAALAQRALGDRALAVTVAAETLAGRELDAARDLAEQVGIEHRVVTHSELDNPEFVANPKHRCYVCQGMRMDLLRRVADEAGGRVVLDGTNASDPGPDRPGLAAIRERGVISPLLDHGIDKTTTRQLARSLGLLVWDRPANACLSSRIPHGQIVTLGKLRRVERAEELLYGHGFEVVRVRHDGEVARVEVGRHELAAATRMWPSLEGELQQCGFAAVELDREGYRSGGADRLIQPTLCEIEARVNVEA
jgi:uncharacterized protein (TIGR00268 family)